MQIPLVENPSFILPWQNVEKNFSLIVGVKSLIVIEFDGAVIAAVHR